MWWDYKRKLNEIILRDLFKGQIQRLILIIFIALTDVENAEKLENSLNIVHLEENVNIFAYFSNCMKYK